MNEWVELALVVAGVFALNLLPAFAPPTAAVLVAVSLNLQIPNAPLILCGALAAACGRLTLATATRRFRGRLPAERREHLDAAEQMLTSHRGGAVAGLGLFALSPVPSGQLFVAAGLMQVRLVPLTAAFFAGRLVSYTLYVVGASAVEASVGDTIVSSMTAPLGIALQVLALVGLALLVRVDWADVLARRAGGADNRPVRSGRPEGT